MDSPVDPSDERRYILCHPVQTFRWKTSLAELRAHPSVLKGTRSGAYVESEVFYFLHQRWRLHLTQRNRLEGTLSGRGYPRGPVEPPNLCLELLDYPPKLTFKISVTCSLTLEDKPIKTRKFDLSFNGNLPWITLGSSKLWPWLGSSGYELWTLENNVIFDNITCSMYQIRTGNYPDSRPVIRSPLTPQNKRPLSPDKPDDDDVMILKCEGIQPVRVKKEKAPETDPIHPSVEINPMTPPVTKRARNVKMNAMSPTVSTTGDADINSNSEELDGREQGLHVRVEEPHTESPKENHVADQKPSSVMKNMLLKKDFSDISLIGSSGRKFHAHKVVLSAWGSVLHNLCLLENEIQMPELSDEAIEGLLEFLYCESVSNMKKLANELFFAAKKYKLEKLKSQCLKSMSAIDLTVENAADMLIFAEQHNVKELKIKAMLYINQHASMVKKTAGFKKLLESHLKLIAELYSCLISSS